MGVLAFIKTGFTTAQGELDDARVNATLLILAYIVMGIYGMSRVFSGEMAAFVQAWAIGGAALCAGIGGWFGLRKDN